jgi:hypothetical protein
MNLDLDTGANDAHIDLSSLRVTDVFLKSGASSTRLTLPARAGYTRVRVEAGAASLRIRVPEGVAARIHTSSGLTSMRINSARFPSGYNGYQSPDFDTAAHKAELEIQTGVGSVEIE